MVTKHELRARLAIVDARIDGDRRRGRSWTRSARLLRLQAHAAFDEAAAAVGKWLHPMGRMDLERVSRETDDALALFEREGWLADPASYHHAPPALTEAVVERRLRRHQGFEFQHVTFKSDWPIHPDEPGRDRWFGFDYSRNSIAHARVLRHDDATRPWVVCVHGTGMGWTRADFSAFHVNRLHQGLGLNVALPVLPLSGPRRPRGRFEIRFPTNDHLDNVHGLAQSVWDLRRLISWIRSLGGEQIATHGISLGGYVVALHAAFEPDLSCVIAGIPASDFISLFEENLPQKTGRAYPGLFERGARLHRAVSPLEHAPTPPVERRFVYGALGDRLVDPAQAHALWEHWDEPAVAWYDGGHIAFARSPVVREFVTTALRSSGMLPERPVDA